MLNLLDETIIRRLQQDIPLVEEPFKLIAEELGMEDSELLDKLKYYMEEGILKRIGAVINHREAGFNGNALVVWRVPENRVEEIGRFLASMAEISHCYERESCDNWDYNIYTMIHGKTRMQCEVIIRRISNQMELKDFKILYSIKELKKSSMKYFYIDR